jgi:hypothetical protein
LPGYTGSTYHGAFTLVVTAVGIAKTPNTYRAVQAFAIRYQCQRLLSSLRFVRTVRENCDNCQEHKYRRNRVEHVTHSLPPSFRISTYRHPLKQRASLSAQFCLHESKVSGVRD